jgi:hypothetical protein
MQLSKGLPSIVPIGLSNLSIPARAGMVEPGCQHW